MDPELREYMSIADRAIYSVEKFEKGQSANPADVKQLSDLKSFGQKIVSKVVDSEFNKQRQEILDELEDRYLIRAANGTEISVRRSSSAVTERTPLNASLPSMPRREVIQGVRDAVLGAHRRLQDLERAHNKPLSEVTFELSQLKFKLDSVAAAPPTDPAAGPAASKCSCVVL